MFFPTNDRRVIWMLVEIMKDEILYRSHTAQYMKKPIRMWNEVFKWEWGNLYITKRGSPHSTSPNRTFLWLLWGDTECKKYHKIYVMAFYECACNDKIMEMIKKEIFIPANGKKMLFNGMKEFNDYGKWNKNREGEMEKIIIFNDGWFSLFYLFAGRAQRPFWKMKMIKTRIKIGAHSPK